MQKYNVELKFNDSGEDFKEIIKKVVKNKLSTGNYRKNDVKYQKNQQIVIRSTKEDYQ